MYIIMHLLVHDYLCFYQIIVCIFIIFLSQGLFCVYIMYVCIFIIFFKFYESFLSLEAVCVFVCMHVDVCGLGTLGCVGRVG